MLIPQLRKAGCVTCKQKKPYMRIKHNELEIPEDDPFKHCALKRRKYSEILTSLIKGHPEGFVLAINNKWGTGKTTFLSMWKQSLQNSGFKTVYFNAWENDYEDNPLTALIGELQIININSEKSFTNVVKNAALLSKNIAPVLIKSLLRKYLGDHIISELAAESAKSVSEIFEEDVKEYSKRKKTIKDFKRSLSEFVATESNENPLIFIIDEIDRCRPNYSVLLLEQIKHFFNVPNIVFVLSIDKSQLCNAICGVYGSEKIDSNEYLKRFIDIEFSIPDPEPELFFDYLYSHYDFKSFFNSSSRISRRDFNYDESNFIFAGKSLIGKLSLRQQEKILAHIRIALSCFSNNQYLIPTIFVFLTFIKITHPSFYFNLKNNTLSLIDVQKEYYSLIEANISEDTKSLFTQIEAFLLKFYENQKYKFKKDSHLVRKNNNTNQWELKLDSLIDNNFLLRNLTSEKMEYEYSDITLLYFIAKLELLENFETR